MPKIQRGAGVSAAKVAPVGEKNSQGMNVVDMVATIKAMVHTFIRFLPLSMYSFAYLSIALYKDLRSAILLLGLILNDIIGLLYNKYAKPRIPATCAIFMKPGTSSEVTNQKEWQELGILPNPHSEIMGFLASFFFSDMSKKGKFDIIPGWFLIGLIVITAWSRMSIQCETFNDIIFNLLRGAIIGVLFYYFFSDYYLKSEKGVIEKKSCDLGYKNYKCDTIQDGVVIVKKIPDQDSDEDSDEKDDNDATYYD